MIILNYLLWVSVLTGSSGEVIMGYGKILYFYLNFGYNLCLYLTNNHINLDNCDC